MHCEDEDLRTAVEALDVSVLHTNYLLNRKSPYGTVSYEHPIPQCEDRTKYFKALLQCYPRQLGIMNMRMMEFMMAFGSYDVGKLVGIWKDLRVMDREAEGAEDVSATRIVRTWEAIARGDLGDRVLGPARNSLGYAIRKHRQAEGRFPRLKEGGLDELLARVEDYIKEGSVLRDSAVRSALTLSLYTSHDGRFRLTAAFEDSPEGTRGDD